MTLKVQSLACVRGGRQVFGEISFALDAGELLLVTGTNGSGKSSLLRLLAGLLPITSGEVRWNEVDIGDEVIGYQQQVAYLGHKDAMKPVLTVDEMLDYWCALSGQKQNEKALEVFGLEGLRQQPIRFLSAGQRRRLALTRLLLLSRTLWLLDEPVTALDMQSQEIFMDVLARHRDAGGMAVMAVHHMPAMQNVKHLTMESMS